MNTISRIAVAAALASTLVSSAFAGQRPSTPASSPVTTPVATATPVPRASTPIVPAAASRSELKSTASTKDYRLGAGDKLRIEVYKDAQLSGPVQVRPDGKITMPLVGDIEASGRTPVELRDTIAAALQEYVKNPSVTVVVVEATAATAYIYGEVTRPGPVTLNGDLTVIQALAMAGGLTEWAKAKAIKILRPGPAGVQAVPFNYREALEGYGTPVYLRPGDTVVVPD
jgi:polysaccharide export outer membrane protein